MYMPPEENNPVLLFRANHKSHSHHAPKPQTPQSPFLARPLPNTFTSQLNVFFSLLRPPSFRSLPDDTVESLLEPPDALVALDTVAGTDTALAAAAAGDTLTGPGHAAVEVHAVDTDSRVVLDAQVDVFADTEAEVAGLAEVALPQLVLLDLEATLENLLGLGATDGDVHGDLLVSPDTEGTDGVSGLAWIKGKTNC